MPVKSTITIPDAEVKVIPLQDALSKWGTISIDKFQEQLVKLNVGEVDGNLMRSFVKEVEIANGDSWSVLIKFLKYGRFIDMGVGRGNPLGSPIVTIGGNRYRRGRQRKNWYSKVKTRETAILHFILRKNYSLLALKTLETQLKTINQS